MLVVRSKEGPAFTTKCFEEFVVGGEIEEKLKGLLMLGDD